MEKKFNISKKIKDNKKPIIIIFSVIVVLITILCVFLNLNNDYIKRVKKVLSAKYYKIVCLDNTCDQIAAYKGSETGKSKVKLLTGDGKVVAKYKVAYDANSKVTKEPYAVAKNYFIYKKIDTKSNKIKGYSLADKKGREKYNTEKNLKVLTDHLAVLDDGNKGVNGYSILDKNGKLLFKNVNQYDIYANGKVISAEIEGRKKILNEKGEIVLSDYYVATEVFIEDSEDSFLLVEDSKNNSYNYFNTKSMRIVGDSFQNYSKNSDGTLTIVKKENNSSIKYTLSKDGKQKKIGSSKTQSELANDIKKELDTKKYNLYSTSVLNEDQKFVFVDDISNKSFGVYNLKTKKYSKIFDYKKDTNSLYSSVTKVYNNNNLNYYQIACSTYYCDNNEFIVYNLDDGKVMYSGSNDKLKIQNYYQFQDGYKVIKYSYSSTDDEYKGKYVLFDSKNKEIYKSSNMISVVDKELLIGSENYSSLILYSAKANKVLNDETTLGSRITLNNNKFYRYQTNKETIIVNTKGREVLKVESGNDIIYSDKLLVYIKNKKLYIFDAAKSKTRKYRLKNNEKMNDASGELIAPFRGAIFINNTSDNYFKVLNYKGHSIKKVKKSTISNVYKNKSNNVVIITKKIGKTTEYGLYIAK